VGQTVLAYVIHRLTEDVAKYLLRLVRRIGYVDKFIGYSINVVDVIDFADLRKA
jgi:hypothetical protein